MNRVDRLMAIVVHLQGRRVVRAEEIAAHFEISVRTVYRDIAALGEAGIPILAEAGVGYSLARGYHLPPVMFTAEEASALSIGGKLVEHLTDASLRKQMESALLIDWHRSLLPLKSRDYAIKTGHHVQIDRPRSSYHRSDTAGGSNYCSRKKGKNEDSGHDAYGQDWTKGCS